MVTVEGKWKGTVQDAASAIPQQGSVQTADVVGSSVPVHYLLQLFAYLLSLKE